MLYQAELRHLAMPTGFEPATVGLDVLRAGSRTNFNNSRVRFKRPTKLWSESYGALPLSYSATYKIALVGFEPTASGT